MLTSDEDNDFKLIKMCLEKDHAHTLPHLDRIKKNYERMREGRPTNLPAHKAVSADDADDA